MSPVFASQLTAVATAVLAVFAVVTALFAALAFRKQSAEVKLLQEQAGRDMEQRRKAQASKVFIRAETVPPHMVATVRIFNSSEQPIYDLSAGAVGKEPVQLPVLMPEDSTTFSAEWRDAVGNWPPVWVDFRDAAGWHWRVTSRGALGELP